MADPSEAVSERWRTTLAAAAALGIAFAFLAMAYTSATPRGKPPDEWAHITYVDEAIESRQALPDYLDSRILPAGKTPNYLKHPPLYYSALGLAGKASGQDASDDYRFFRAISAAFVALGLALWIVTARLLGLGLAKSVPIVLSVNALPMFPYLAGSINNDNLAYLGVAIAFLGLAAVRRLPRAAWYIGAAGLAIALLTKGTAGLFLALVFGGWVCASLAANARGLLSNRHFLASLSLLVLVVGGYYLSALVHYGAFLPTAGALYEHESPTGQLLGFGGFLQAFLGLMARHLAMVVDHAPVAPLAAPGRWLLYASLCLPLLGYVLSKRTGRREPVDLLADLAMGAALVTLAAHVLITWESYLRLGSIHSTQPRYYFYLLPTLAVLVFAKFRQSRALHAVLLAFMAIALVMSVLVPVRTIRAEQLRHAPVQAEVLVLPPAAGGALRRVQLERGPVGWLGQASRNGAALSLRGWAIDLDTAEPATRVEVYYDGQLVGSIVPARPRPDVAASLGDDDARFSGFEGEVRGVPAEVTACDLQLAAVQRSGRRIALATARTLCP